MVLFSVCDLRWDGIQAKGLPWLHSLSAAKWCHPGPGGESKGHPRGPGWLSRLLQQLRRTLPEPGSLCGGNPQLFLRLRPICLFWSLLWERYTRSGPVHRPCGHVGPASAGAQGPKSHVSCSPQGLLSLSRLLICESDFSGNQSRL